MLRIQWFKFPKHLLSVLGCYLCILITESLLPIAPSLVAQSKESGFLVQENRDKIKVSNAAEQGTTSEVYFPNWLYPVPTGLRNRDKNSSGTVRTSGGTFSGSQCQETNIPLTALVPEMINGNSSESVKYPTLTTQNSPTLWFYIPNFGPERLSAKLQVRDLSISYPDSDVIYEEIYELSNYSGIARIPTRIRELKVSKDYKWDFSIICDSQDPSKDHLVSGVFRKVEIDFQVDRQSPEQKARSFYREAIWNDTFSTLMDELYITQPERAIVLIQQLLFIVDLKDVAESIFNEVQESPSLQCCSYQTKQSEQSSQPLKPR